MKPAAFDYHAPPSIQETLAMLATFVRDDRNVKLLAGGQSLIPLMNIRLAEPEIVIDLNGLEAELSYVRLDGSTLRIGALTRHHHVADDPLVLAHAPLLAEATSLIGHAAILSRGTIGGSLVHADPAAEFPLAAVALGATVTLRKLAGARTLDARDFFLAALTSDVEPDEILVETVFPVMPPRSGQAIAEFSRRHGDFAIVAAAAQISLASDGTLADARLAVGGATQTPLACAELLDPLVGSVPSDGALRGALSTVAALVDPDADIHANADDRRELAVEMALRATRRALERARARLAD
ncbi:MAG TPA: FAD binding domain-containing protein [Candidatus Limnocylindria bacterium]|nr:FAD binding domain-containing protein [Candidatus Limnocylindria bacterium]